MDAFLVAATFPGLIGMYILSCVSVVLIPQFNKFKSEDKAEAFISTLFVALVILCVILFIVGCGIHGLLLKIFMPKLADNVRLLAIKLGPLMWLLAIFQIMFGFFASLLQANNRFSAQGVAPLIFSLSIIMCVAGLAAKFGIWAYALGNLLGTMIQTALVWHSARRVWKLDFNHLEWRFLTQFMLVSWPLVLGGLITRVVPVIERVAASNLPTGTISQLSYAQRILGTVTSLTLTGLVGMLLPRLSELSNSLAEFLHELRLTLHMVLFLVTPMLVFMIFYFQPLTRILLVHGAFTHVDAKSITRAMALYGPYALVGAVGSVLGKALFAFQLTKESVLIDACGICVYGVSLFCGIKYLGKDGIPVALSIYLIFSAVLVAAVVLKRAGGSWSDLFSDLFVKLSLSVCSMLAASLVVFKLLSSTNLILGVVLAGIVGSVVYLTTAYFLNFGPGVRFIRTLNVRLRMDHNAD